MKPPVVADILKTSLPADQVEGTLDTYQSFHEGTLAGRKANCATMVNQYYDLATDFYEFGWGQSFHYAPRHKHEGFAASLARHELYLAAQLGLRPGMNVLDVGCGVGGPMREIARFSGANIVGVNNNDYQIKRGTLHNTDARLSDKCSFIKADFMKLPVEKESFDAVYAIEATCHAPDKVALFTELARVMKPGGHFAGYEWCTTDLYRPTNPEHAAIKKAIELGNGLPDLWTMPDVVDALGSAGLEVVESRDIAPTSDPETPWYFALSGRFSIDGFKHTPVGRWLTRNVLRVLEAAHLAPKGTVSVATFLAGGAEATVRGGKTGIFTPMFYFHARKPKA